MENDLRKSISDSEELRCIIALIKEKAADLRNEIRMAQKYETKPSAYLRRDLIALESELGHFLVTTRRKEKFDEPEEAGQGAGS